MDLHEIEFGRLYDNLNQENMVNSIKDIYDFVQKEFYEDEAEIFFNKIMKNYSDEVASLTAKYISYIYVDGMQVDFHDNYFNSIKMIYHENRNDQEVAMYYAKVLWYTICCKVRRYNYKELLDELMSIYHRYKTNELFMYVLEAMMTVYQDELPIEDMHKEISELVEDYFIKE